MIKNPANNLNTSQYSAYSQQIGQQPKPNSSNPMSFLQLNQQMLYMQQQQQNSQLSQMRNLQKPTDMLTNLQQQINQIASGGS